MVCPSSSINAECEIDTGMRLPEALTSSHSDSFSGPLQASSPPVRSSAMGIPISARAGRPASSPSRSLVARMLPFGRTRATPSGSVSRISRANFCGARRGSRWR